MTTTRVATSGTYRSVAGEEWFAARGLVERCTACGAEWRWQDDRKRAWVCIGGSPHYGNGPYEILDWRGVRLGTSEGDERVAPYAVL